MSPLVKVGAVLALLVALVACLFAGVKGIDQRGYNRAKSEATAALEAQKREADQVLATETAKTRTAEAALRTFKLNQDTKDAQAKVTIATLSNRLHSLAGNDGRLRDPNAPGCGGVSGSPQGEAAAASPDRPGDGAQAGGLLSAELTGLLQRLAGEADAINLAYASCRSDALQVRALQP
jgi:hypothetical protein